ncbi:MAG: Mur ligase family protein [Patescibacteria group bacterium]
MKIKNFVEAEQFLALHIPKTTQQTFPGELGLKRAKYFLHLLGDPQEKLKIIHVAGTSGKGSTCYLISSLLSSQGFKVGLHQSPHLTDVTERFQINGKIISQKEFVFYLNEIIPIINPFLTYFEILVGMAFYIFADKKVDYTVMETGLGGRYDGTNVVSRSDKLSVLTKIGLDHTNILGKTIEEITLQKAMIINKNSQAISIKQDLRAEKVIREVAKKRNAKIQFVSLLSSPRRRGSSAFCLDSRLRGNDNTIQLTKNLNLIGEYQKENASLALAAVDYLSNRDGFVINQNKIKKVLETANFPGRFDIKKINGKTVIFDGAHNPQKMEAFISSLIKKYPKKKINFLLTFKKGKDYQGMLKIIILSTIVGKIIITSFFTKNQDMINQSEDIKNIINVIKNIKFINFITIPDLKKAWDAILKEKEGLIVVTGSLYLVGEVFRLIKN